MQRTSILLTSTLLLLLAAIPHAHAQLVVHEWGTMTTLHAPDGTAQGRMNLIADSEQLPQFVYHYEPRSSGDILLAPFAKGSRTPGRPDVTMRLETPVIYFYDRGNVIAGRNFDVRVQMRGGILNDFYPRALAAVAQNGVDRSTATSPIVLDQQWAGSLTWSGLSLDAGAPVPRTNAVVWTAPRKVQASKVRVGRESEHYLFYRGVANLNSLLATDHSRTAVRLRAPRSFEWLSEQHATVTSVWLVDVRADGSLAFAVRRNLVLAKDAPLATLAEIPRFDASDYERTQGAALRQSMHSELVAAGLFADEATAMLATWDASYFRKPGLRVFYTVPLAWTDYYLPLELSVPHEATRVLIGRIDLMTADETT